MGEKIIVGPINKGLRTDRTPFVIDNDSFPTLINAYQWRGRVKRKRGTGTLGRLKRGINNAAVQTNGVGNFSGNLISILGLQANSSIVLNSILIGVDSFTDTTPPTGILTGSTIGTGTINYATGALTITGGPPNTTIQFQYYPDLPVMGLRDLVIQMNQFPGTIAFDTVYSYNIVQMFPYNIYDVSFYKNPTTGTYPGYIQKAVWTPTTWNGQDYQQFWTTNYQGAFWATNSIDLPFTGATIGMQFKPIVTVTITAGGPPAITTLNIVGHGLVQGDFLFINEVSTTTGINFQTGYVILVIDANNVSVEFPNATLVGNGAGGIAQYLTNRSNPAKDCLRWYDGDPTNGIPPNPSSTFGWVNFAPPLSRAIFSIDDKIPAQYYLVGARMIVPFKDRLLFIGPVIQASSGNPLYLEDTVIYSQNGTPFYTASFTGDPSLATTVFTPILVPTNQTATVNAYWEDQTGFGGFISAGIDQQLTTVSANEDALILGFDRLQTRFIYTGNDIVPFSFFIVNSELGSSSTFSVINQDKGVITRGNRGYVITNQVGSERIDLPIPDQVFEIRLLQNGTERFTAQRDFINEWIYFTYPNNESTNRYPTQTLQFNYRDDTWALFNESYTAYGQFRPSTGYTWATIGTVYPSWNVWDQPWNASQTTLLQAQVIAGNQQGFIVFRAQGTSEVPSLYIQNIVGSVVTSVDHCLNEGDYIVITGAVGTVSTQVNGLIFSVSTPTQNTFNLNPSITGGTYLGGGVITRMYVPFIQTKQFPTSWGIARKTRLGPQQYLLSTTANGQITLLIFLSQNDENAYNLPPIVPSLNVQNNTLIYNTTLFTCPESTNLGLTPANINLQMVTAEQQAQIWHRMNTSLIGDTVQIGFTMSDAQMRDTTFSNQFVEIELHGFILDVQPSQILA